MKARLILILIFLSTLAVITTNGKSKLFSPQDIIILNKTISLNTEMIIGLIILLTLVGLLAIGIIDRIFFSRKKKEHHNEEVN